MNRLILIGNGFDLAHGMKTSYNDFIIWYLRNVLKEVWANFQYEDTLLKIDADYQFQSTDIPGVNNADDLVDCLYRDGFIGLTGVNTQVKIGTQYYPLNLKVNVKSPFFRRLLNNCSDVNWVDIERHFYAVLKSLINNNRNNKEAVNNLNDEMSFLIEQLKMYLLTISADRQLNEYRDIFTEKITIDHLVDRRNFLGDIDNTMILNFNYTSTAEKYIDDLNAELIYIHGNLADGSNPLIFGFGDEMDSNYQEFENLNNNHFFKYIKTFWYLKTANYNKLIRFISASNYQVFILGHSCGLSDRTMLHTIFENELCKSIKIFYYRRKDGSNNFEELTHEISRHFKYKEALREKIVKLPFLTHMPQL
jgi:abortive infection AbiH-like protein